MRQNTTHPNKRKTTETTLRQYIKINQLYGTKRLSNFQLSVEINPRLQRFSFPSVCDWSSKLAPPSGPIRCKTKANYDLVARVFRSFELFGCFNYILLRCVFTSTKWALNTWKYSNKKSKKINTPISHRRWIPLIYFSRRQTRIICLIRKHYLGRSQKWTPSSWKTWLGTYASKKFIKVKYTKFV